MMNSLSVHTQTPSSTFTTATALPSVAGRVHQARPADIRSARHSTEAFQLGSERNLYSTPDDGTRVGDFYGLPGGLEARGDGGSLNTNMGDYWAADAKGAGEMAAQMVQELSKVNPAAAQKIIDTVQSARTANTFDGYTKVVMKVTELRESLASTPEWDAKKQRKAKYHLEPFLSAWERDNSGVQWAGLRAGTAEMARIFESGASQNPPSSMGGGVQVTSDSSGGSVLAGHGWKATLFAGGLVAGTTLW